ncbi:ATPase domain-containing protein [Thermococcus paralvinellae]|uniref:KaiC-like domain-containing protein n=1 Tax=Thermococcus paralvinellae TaxID=582419 RepID=W0I8P4_9EURY|nr:ATPase domain-containing protein [Thermococcus paralvinellae]AHF81112.1 Hypothetical protein TES1_1737 [Thermococcus paralvinellae]
MVSEVIKTGIREIDEALGGGLINRGTLLISYDKRSLGWVIAGRVLKNLMKYDAVGVIFNVTLPLSKLMLRAKYLGIDIDEEGEKGNLYIVDLFGSKHGILYDKQYVYQITDWHDETALPKLIRLSQEIFSRIPKNKLIVVIVVTLEGLYHEFGEEFMNNAIKAAFAGFEKGQLDGLNMVMISLLNREAVPDTINAWLYTINDQVIEFTSHLTPEGFEETILIPKSSIPGFKVKCYTTKIAEKEDINIF